MKSHYFFEKEDNYIRMVVSGEYDFDDFKTYLKIIYAKCENEKIYKIVLDALGVEGIDIPTLERYFLGVEAAEQLQNKIKLAVLWHKEYTTYLAQTVVLDKGGQICVFENNEQAIEWLISGINL
jgi:hypothetical protein